MSAVLGRNERDPYESRVDSEPQIAERIDPVVYSKPGSKGPLTREQVRQYDHEGFLEIDGVFSDAELRTLVAELNRLRAAPEGIDRETLILEPGGHELRSIFAIHAQSALFARLAADERLAGVARYLLGDEVYIHQSRLNYKPGFFGKEFYWHSDFETWHVEDGMPRMRALSISITLTDNMETNGPLMVIPGSHRTFVACVGETPDDHYKTSLKRQDIGVPDDDSLARLVEQGGIVSTAGKAGSLIVFDCNLMHGSNGNITPLPRSNAFFAFNAMSNATVEPFGGTKRRPEFLCERRPRPLARAA